MQFFLKFFRALNSAQTPWQVTLAVTLGMVAGLTPMVGLLNVVFLFLAFLINIHLGLFFVVSAIFAGIGYLFDPLFEQIGYAILSNDGLEGLWTAFYNNGLLRTTQFNNTLVMGSTVVALALALPLYFVLDLAIKRYRQGLSALLSKAPKLGMMGILKVQEKPSPLIRWWGAGLFVVVGAAVTAFGFLLLDPLAKWGLEKGITDAIARDVRIGGVNVGVADGSVTIDRIEVASEVKGVDLVSVEQVAIDLDLGALLFNRTHIEDLRISGMGFETPETMAKAPVITSQNPAQGDDEGVIDMLTPELPTPESLLESADLQTVAVYKKAEAEITQMVEKWRSVASGDVLSEGKLGEFQRDFESLKQKSESRDPAQLLALAEEVLAFQEKVTDYNGQLSNIREDLVRDRQRLVELYDEMQAAKTADYNRLKEVYEASTGGVQGIVGALAEKQLQEQITQALEYYKMVEPYLQSEPEPPVPPRGEGRLMKFALNEPSPDLWVAKTTVSGQIQGQTFGAKISDISDNQVKLGRPITFSLESDGPTISQLIVSGEDNRVGDRVFNKISFSSAGFPLQPTQVEMLELGAGTVAFDGNLVLEDMSTLSGTTAVTVSDSKISFTGGDAMLDLAGSTLSSLDAFTADISLEGSVFNPGVSVATDLDEKIAEAFQAGVSKEAMAYTEELQSQLNAQVGDQLTSLKGSAGGMAGMDNLLDDRVKALTDLKSSAGSLATEGSATGLLDGVKSFFK